MLKKFRKNRNQNEILYIFANEIKTVLKMELLTEKQKARKQRDAEVVAAYRELRRKCPNASRTRIFDELAKNNVGGLKSIYGIRQALINQRAI